MNKTFIITLFINITISFAQQKGTINGRVLDKQVQNPIPYATIQLKTNTENLIISEADSMGYYNVDSINIGVHSLIISATGYKSIIETVLIDQSINQQINFYLEEDVTVLSDVIITSEEPSPYKTTSHFEFSSNDLKSGTTTFGDPSRLVQTLPGVSTQSDGSNKVTVRGNSPFNNNWYIDGTEVPNPNHFGGVGSSAGFISIYNESNLEKFDFYLSGYPSLYGNSNSSVFDLKLKNGDVKKKQTSFKISPIGLYLSTEGPISKKRKSSYLVNGRLFDLYFFQKYGVIPTENFTIPKYNDVSYKINLPNKSDKTTLSIYGFNGKSILDTKYADYLSKQTNQTNCVNLTINHRINANSRINSTLQYSKTLNATLQKIGGIDTFHVKESIFRNHTYYQTKSNSRFSLRVGFVLSQKFFSANIYAGKIVVKDSVTGYHSFYTGYTNENIKSLNSEAYFSSNYRFSNRLKLTSGVHLSNVSFNSRINFEPRSSITHDISRNTKQIFSIGVYSKTPTPLIYKFSDKNTPNIKSLHLIYSFTYKIDTSLIVKSEIYFQHLWNVYLLRDSNATNSSTLNFEDIAVRSKSYEIGKLSIGRNYGIDLIVKKIWGNTEVSVAGSVYRSMYLDSEKRWRNTAFDNKFNSSIQFLKQYLAKKNYGQKTCSFSAKLLYFGGFYTVPIDLENSIKTNSTTLNSDLLFSEKLPNYFRIDFGFQIGFSRPMVKHEIRVDIQNATNRKNISSNTFDKISRSIKYTYQLPLIPVITYSLFF